MIPYMVAIPSMGGTIKRMPKICGTRKRVPNIGGTRKGILNNGWTRGVLSHVMVMFGSCWWHVPVICE